MFVNELNPTIRKIAYAANLNDYSIETLVHDINNLRGDEWTDVVINNCSSETIKEFCKIAHVEIDFEEACLLAADIKMYLHLDETDLLILRNNLIHYNIDGLTDQIKKSCPTSIYDRYIKYIKSPAKSKHTWL